MTIRLEYNPGNGYPWHFATKYDIPNTFGWRTIRENIDEEVASEFITYAERHELHRKLNAQQMRQELADWLYLYQ